MREPFVYAYDAILDPKGIQQGFQSMLEFRSGLETLLYRTRFTGGLGFGLPDGLVPKILDHVKKLNENRSPPLAVIKGLADTRRDRTIRVFYTDGTTLTIVMREGSFEVGFYFHEEPQIDWIAPRVNLD